MLVSLRFVGTPRSTTSYAADARALIISLSLGARLGRAESRAQAQSAG